MKNIGKITGLLGAGALIVALNAGGIAGCGSSNGSSGGGGGGVSNSDATAAALTTLIGSLSELANPSGGGAALTVRAQQAGLKAATSPCSGDPSTSITCTCEGGGSFTFAFGSSTDDLSFDNCVDVDGNTINGDATISSSSSGATITYHDLTSTLVDCGTFTLNGTVDIVSNSDGSADETLNLTATSGSDTVNIDGNLTVNNDETVSGTLDYTGAVTINCSFNHDDLSDCNNFADACGITASDICTGTDYRTDICN